MHGIVSKKNQNTFSQKCLGESKGYYVKLYSAPDHFYRCISQFKSSYSKILIPHISHCSNIGVVVFIHRDTTKQIALIVVLVVKRVMTLWSIREQIRGQAINMLHMMIYCIIGWELLRVLWWSRVELGIWVDWDCSSRGWKPYSWGEDKLDAAFLLLLWFLWIYAYIEIVLIYKGHDNINCDKRYHL